MKVHQSVFVCILYSLFSVIAVAGDIASLSSPQGANVLTVSLHKGELSYRIKRKAKTVLDRSPLGLTCLTGDFAHGLVLQQVEPVVSVHQQYQLMVGNRRSIDSKLLKQAIILKNLNNSQMTLEVIASNEGFAFRYLLDKSGSSQYTVVNEQSGFQIPATASGWLQPYHAAGPYTPAYEDFFFKVSPGDSPPRSRHVPRGWCLPGLFEIPSAESWILLAESDVDDTYCASHLQQVPGINGLYQIALAYEDEVTGAKSFNSKAKQSPVTTHKTPWRIVIIADQPAGILNSTLVTDLAAPSQIQDTSWIKPGRASWAWWSHPDGPAGEELFNEFTDLAAEFEWEYTLFDAGWWGPGLCRIADYAKSKGIQPLAWSHAGDFYDADKRRRKLDEMVAAGIKGIKVDFWCSDRQEAMRAIQETLRDSAQRKLVVNLHGCSIPRGWHRTWPNLLTAEAVLGVESYFYEPRYSEKTAEQNTILPFTRNVMAPMDVTPIGITIRKYPRKVSAVHEVAAALIAGSGIIHYADSCELFYGLPKAVKKILRSAPAAWDETRCLEGEPGKRIILARRKGNQWIIAGLNGTSQLLPVKLDLKAFGNIRDILVITEGPDSLTQFSVEKLPCAAEWQYPMISKGGFILSFENGDW